MAVEPNTVPITTVDLSTITPPEAPLKNYSEEDVDKHMSHIEHFGRMEPLRIWRGTILDGDAWYIAAEHLQLTQVDVIDLSHLEEHDARAYAIAIKKLNESGKWDWKTLAGEFEYLATTQLPDMDLTAFYEDERRDLITHAADQEDDKRDDDFEPTERKVAISETGDIWQLDTHRLMCGDSTNHDHVYQLMDGANADFLFTSPPYLQQRDYQEKITNWDMLMNGVFDAAELKQGAQVLVNLGLVHKESEWLPYWTDWMDYMRRIGWKRFALYVWDQGPGLPGDHNGRLAPSFELIFHFCKEPRTARKTTPKKSENIGVAHMPKRGTDGAPTSTNSPMSGMNTHKIPDSVIRVTRQKGSIGKFNADHPAILPLALVDEVMRPYTKADDVCYEPFCGSGTQIIAAEKNERICYAMEIAPIYVDLAIERWEHFTQNDAIHVQTGKTYTELRRIRTNQT